MRCVNLKTNQDRLAMKPEPTRFFFLVTLPLLLAAFPLYAQDSLRDVGHSDVGHSGDWRPVATERL